MRERGIIMSRPMVLATKADLKDETRRLSGLEKVNQKPDKWRFGGFKSEPDAKGRLVARFVHVYEELPNIHVACPYGAPGDRLWLRETCRLDEATGWWYAADFEFGELEAHRWTPAVHMPRRACRITADLREVRLERAHAITELGAVREGVEKLSLSGETYYRNYGPKGGAYRSARDSYASLWDQLNAAGRKATPFRLNPWVWVLRYAPHVLDPAAVFTDKTATA
jgi:hypothetical protein